MDPDLLEPPAENVMAWAAGLDMRWIDDQGQAIERPRPVVPGDPRDIARRFISERGLTWEPEEILALWTAWRFYQQMGSRALHRDWLRRAYPNVWRRVRAANVGVLFDAFLAEIMSSRAQYPDGLSYVDARLSFGEALSSLRRTHEFAGWGSRGPVDKTGAVIPYLCDGVEEELRAQLRLGLAEAERAGTQRGYELDPRIARLGE